MLPIEEMTNYDTDKGLNFRQVYDEYFAAVKNKAIALFEVGVLRGGSLLMWRDYFPNGKIVGLDVNPVHFEDPTGRVSVYQGYQQDVALLSQIAKERAPDGFDIIIDDASHFGNLTSITFWHLFENHLKPGGLYIVEDWGTGYWGAWPDGSTYKAQATAGSVKKKWLPIPRFLRPRKEQIRSHQYGMVGFLKQLIDECARADITAPGEGRGTPPFTLSKIERIAVFSGIFVVVKAGKVAH